MIKVKKTIVVLAVLAIAALSAFRVAQVISGRKNEEPKRQAMGQVPLVEVAPVTQGLIEEKIFRTGDIVPDAQVTIYSKVQGWVEKINVREGDRVKAGQVLITLDSREAQAAVAQAEASLEAARARLKQVKATSEEVVQSQVHHAKANLDLAEAELNRARELYEKNFIARQQLDEAHTKYNVAKAAYDLALNSIRQKTWENDIALAEAQVRQAKATLDLTQAQLANLIIPSPMDGGVTKRFVDPGTMVKDTTAILTLMDLHEVKMVVNVIEKEFVRLQKGQPVKVTVTAFPDRIFQGRIAVITPALEPQSRTAEIQISIPNPGYILNPGMFGRAEILLRSNPQAILVPIQAIITEGDKDFVFLLKDGKAYRRIVQKGLVKDTHVEITGGLNLGEQVITAGHVFLKDGMPVRLMDKSEKKPME
ncbi:MAG: efflux RND transporter periplasmic adaptor subunit [Deltaproteobacteria bacterium]|nr:efflux RND transporter periplasmic adaptor subunit [Deltaproteobacteria bacterium]